MRTIVALVVSLGVALSQASPLYEYPPAASSYAPPPPPPPPPPPALPPALYAPAAPYAPPVDREVLKPEYVVPAPAPPVHLPTHYQPAPPLPYAGPATDPQAQLPEGQQQLSRPRAPDGAIQLPEGGRVLLTDDHLQYTQGYNDKGTKVSEQGRLISTNDGWEAVIVKEGSYSYISPEGVPITVNYIADENGFRVLSR